MSAQCVRVGSSKDQIRGSDSVADNERLETLEVVVKVNSEALLFFLSTSRRSGARAAATFPKQPSALWYELNGVCVCV